jgi:hypothetical protein
VRTTDADAVRKIHLRALSLGKGTARSLAERIMYVVEARAASWPAAQMSTSA